MNLELHRHNKTTFQLFYDKFLCQSFSTQVGLNSAKNNQYWTLSRCNISHFFVKNPRKTKTSSATLVTVWVKFHPKCHPENLKKSPKCHQNGTKVAPKGDTFIFSKSKYKRININILFKLSLVGEVLWRFGDALKTCRWHFGWNFTKNSHQSGTWCFDFSWIFDQKKADVASGKCSILIFFAEFNPTWALKLWQRNLSSNNWKVVLLCLWSSRFINVT